MPNTRDPADVIDQILVSVPMNEERLRIKLETIRVYSTYLPPEYKYPTWMKLVDVLNSYLHIPPVLEWEKEIQAIMKRPAG